MDSTHLATRIRIDALRMTSMAGSSHIGSVFSIADILAVLYGEVMAVRPSEPRWSERDRFILSKGHAGAGVYAALAETGFFPIEKLATYCQDGSEFNGHVSHKGVPGVELSTGSLGHGLSIGAGMAYSAKLDGAGYRTFVLLSDGECDEGMVWEAAMFAAHHRLNALTAIIDFNKIQSLDTVEKTLALEPFAGKWSSFGWIVQEVDGHNHLQLRDVLSRPLGANDRPTCVIAHTTKGKGVSFMQDSVLWHYRAARGAEFDAALAELEGAR
jgi:transketolase